MTAPKVTLVQENFWTELHKIGNEMRLEKQGRKLFPLLEFKVEADRSIDHFLAVLVFKNTETNEESPMVVVGKTGEELREKPLSFAHVKITCDEEEESQTTILLEKFTHYVPVLRLYTDIAGKKGFEPLSETIFDFTKFKTVALYSASIQDFKNKNNPVSKSRAKGWEAWKNWATESSAKRRRVRNDPKSEKGEESDGSDSQQ